jgi:hypothetical protein
MKPTALALGLFFITLTSPLLESVGYAADTKAPKVIIIETLIDGPSELRVKKDGVYWINGGNAKPGRHDGQEEPTYVNGKSWRPNWRESEKDRGVDRSATKSVEGVDPAKTEFNLVMVGFARDSVGIEKRDEIQITRKEGELSIVIPDGQSGSRWYRFELIQRP